MRKGFIMIAVAIIACGAMTKSFAEPVVSGKNKACYDCHKKMSASLVKEWEHSQHAQKGIGCQNCHKAESGEPDAWEHQGEIISTLVTPKDCSKCHTKAFKEFTSSHHAKAGEIMASLDNVLADKAEAQIGAPYAAANGCWQCHGSIINFERNKEGAIQYRTFKVNGKDEKRPILDHLTWPNSGMGRLNPDGSKGSCHACHSRHDFNSKLARNPENCGKCHMGPDHPQLEIFNESKHGIAFNANKERMNLDKKGTWVLGEDYSAAPTCATCHTSAYKGPDGVVAGTTHDVGDRISWTLRPVISKKLNQVIYDDGFKEDFPHDKALPKVGDTVDTNDSVVENFKLVKKKIARKVAKIITWEQRRDAMKEVCSNCHMKEHTDNFYKQYDGLVNQYDDKFAIPAQKLMDQLGADKLLPGSPFTSNVQWTFYELWHHEGRRARHGAAMMGPDYTHWHGTYEVAKHFYTKFLPEVVEQAEKVGGPEMGEKYKKIVGDLVNGDDHKWLKGLTPEEVEALKKAYQERYGK